MTDASPLRVGLAVPNQFEPGDPLERRIHQVVEEVRLAKEVGFEGLLAGEHRLSDSQPYCAAFPFLGRLAAEAEGMTLVAVSVLPLHHPVHVAEDGATLDAICGGRFVLAAALGYREIEMDALGIAPGERVSRLTESLDVLEQLWTQDEVEHSGEWFTVPHAPVSTRPTRPGGPPIWMAASGDAGVRRAARRGLPWLAAPSVGLATLRRQRREYAQFVVADPEEVPVIREVIIDTDEQAAWERARRYLGPKYEAYADAGHDRAIEAGESFRRPFDELARDRFIIGTPDECREQISRLRAEVGMTWLFAHFHWAGIPAPERRRMMRLFGTTVMGSL